MSYAVMGILVNGMKRTFKEKRPDTNARNSFPSGHTAQHLWEPSSYIKNIKVYHLGLVILGIL